MKDEKKYYAHSLEGRPQKEWQHLDVHLKNVAEKAAEFASAFQSSDWAWNAGMLHDLGKADNGFQAYLCRENGLDDSDYDGAGRVNHSSAGSALAVEKLGKSGQILAYLLAGHHAGLPDWYSSETGNAALPVRLEEGEKNLERIRIYAESKLTELKSAVPPERFRKAEYYHLWIRMLYSCLVDADFLDTETFMNDVASRDRTGFAGLKELKLLFDTVMDRKVADAPKTEVNAIRQEILSACRNAAQQASGLFSLTVPTGGGKTLSSMAFALGHAVKNNKERIIYVIPYTSIIEQTAGIFREIFGDENVIEHHSNLDPEKETQRSRLASENWDAPIIVTTNVRFFESLYSARSSSCRKLHNIVNSIIILDEAQLIPPTLLDPCVDVMNQLVGNYSVTMVLSTATQPALPKIDKATEIIPEDLRLYDRLKRTEYSFPDLQKPTDWTSLAQELQKYDQVLCVVNTRRDCYDLFMLMPGGTIHLSALMCGAHRSKIITEIKEKLHNNQPIRVISTQLVEAGVDIDFPVVYRALAGLDSIAQAAGRCNREGKLHLGQVKVFMPPKAAPRGLLLKGEQKTRELISTGAADPQRQETFTHYFKLFYGSLNDTGGKFKDLLVKDANPNLYFQFRTAGNDFKMIDDNAQMPVIVRYGDSEKWLDQVKIIGPTRDNMRKLQRFTVNLSKYIATSMLADGRLEEVNKKMAPGIIAQCSMKLYDATVGLDVYKDNLPVEDLMV